MLSKQDTLDNWKNNIAIARKIKEETVDSVLRRHRDYYRGEHWKSPVLVDISRNSPEYTEQTVENLIFSTINTIRPSINLHNPKIFVNPSKKPYIKGTTLFDTSRAAFFIEQLINHLWRTLNIKGQTDRCLGDALLGHWGLMNVGYTFKRNKIKDGKIIEPHTLIKEDSPFAVRTSPLDLIVDPEASDHDLMDARWIGLRWEADLDSIKANSIFSNTSNLEPNSKSQQDSDIRTDQQKMTEPIQPHGTDGRDDSLLDRVIGWDIWDKKNQQLMTIVESHDYILQKRDWPLSFNGFPIKTLWFNFNPDSLLPVSDVAIQLPGQDELNRLRSLQMDHVRRISQAKYLASQGRIIAEEKNKITNGPSGTIAEVKGDASTAIVPLRDASVSQDFYIMINALRQGIRENMGVSDFERGVAKKFETATEPALIQQGITIKRTERSTVLENFIKTIAVELFNIIQQTIRPMSVPLDNAGFQEAINQTPDRLESQVVPTKAIDNLRTPIFIEKRIGRNETKILLPWLNLNKQDIQGEFDFEIEAGSTQPVSDEIRKRDAVQFAQITKESRFVNQEEVMRDVVEAYKRKDVDRILLSKETIKEQSIKEQQKRQQEVQSQMAIDKNKNKDKLQVESNKAQLKAEVDREKIQSNERVELLQALTNRGNGGSK